MLRAHLLETVCLIEDALRKMTRRKLIKGVIKTTSALIMLYGMLVVGRGDFQTFRSDTTTHQTPVYAHFEHDEPARVVAMLEEHLGVRLVSPSLHSAGSMHQGSTCSFTTYDVDELNRRHDKDRAAQAA